MSSEAGGLTSGVGTTEQQPCMCEATTAGIDSTMCRKHSTTLDEERERAETLVSMAAARLTGLWDPESIAGLYRVAALLRYGSRPDAQAAAQIISGGFASCGCSWYNGVRTNCAAHAPRDAQAEAQPVAWMVESIRAVFPDRWLAEHSAGAGETVVPLYRALGAAPAARVPSQTAAEPANLEAARQIAAVLYRMRPDAWDLPRLRAGVSLDVTQAYAALLELVGEPRGVGSTDEIPPQGQYPSEAGAPAPTNPAAAEDAERPERRIEGHAHQNGDVWMFSRFHSLLAKPDPRATLIVHGSDRRVSTTSHQMVGIFDRRASVAVGSSEPSEERIQRSIEDYEAGRYRPAKEALAELREKHFGSSEKETDADRQQAQRGRLADWCESIAPDMSGGDARRLGIIAEYLRHGTRAHSHVCATCGGDRWVCEEHPSEPQDHDDDDDCRGAGAPCPDCNPLAQRSTDGASVSTEVKDGEQRGDAGDRVEPSHHPLNPTPDLRGWMTRWANDDRGYTLADPKYRLSARELDFRVRVVREIAAGPTPQGVAEALEALEKRWREFAANAPRLHTSRQLVECADDLRRALGALTKGEDV